ncbi:MAG: hydrogenase accessory protein HypB [Candidatus Lambdaproteobacteria bacterium RIFOXYD1_FULL_56_27]|uniref:Hydrogenase maturation factor HypB n=1 Tax=Candidatus Lambdaproteobacteria bacterium RIFOXYD2_FULL_56_26 TaxID=1817773 RepID=A0A1F6GV61_9PROT|nr:MAG: hydrogenase accessory protein HypB [Candidatus Lambdaproteobacteria bacterium RIFOXYC1_FULL_56_13]OGH02063.1 MAG: hydrogenase accessory protein HypB [Candidatus Lambdaproteobacteria bacterium RIFOXYD2_FULL_56_26]OGH07713.1 MAG: hydrogenase accessory protein HypB [Candidatus Lambdaproteobacteria bacterium RIFOXYD1_FULL_56_27]
MCQDCGCLEVGAVTLEGVPLGSDHHSHAPLQEHDHGHGPELRRLSLFHGQGQLQEISIKQRILSRNDHLAQHNRELLQKAQVFATNWISAPGSGKTRLIERMLEDNRLGQEIFVIEGDQETSRDRDRIRAKGGQAVQINTGSACHLDAHMVHEALHQLPLKPKSFLVIENVGNMVCPTAFDLGEAFKVAVISCTEGEDKPLKYPDLITNAKVLLINKIDLLPHLDFDLEACGSFAKRINPAITVFAVSAKTGEGMEAFYAWVLSAKGAETSETKAVIQER